MRGRLCPAVHRTQAVGKEAQRPLCGNRRVQLGALCIFTYVGAEVAIGSNLIAYLSDQSVMGLALEAAGKLVAMYWLGALAGRLLGGFILRLAKPARRIAPPVVHQDVEGREAFNVVPPHRRDEQRIARLQFSNQRLLQRLGKARVGGEIGGMKIDHAHRAADRSGQRRGHLHPRATA